MKKQSNNNEKTIEYMPTEKTNYLINNNKVSARQVNMNAKKKASSHKKLNRRLLLDLEHRKFLINKNFS